MSNKKRYVAWLESTVVHGLTPDYLERLAVAIETRPPTPWQRDTPEAKAGIARRLRKWKQTGLPRTVMNWLNSPPTRIREIDQALECSAYHSEDMAQKCTHKHEGHRNAVEIRIDRGGRTCQVCGRETVKGEHVIQATRRRSEMSNRTGYCHLRCHRHLKIKEGEKVVRRNVIGKGRGHWVPDATSPQHGKYVEDPNQTIVRGCQLKRQRCLNTGGKPTHVIWLGCDLCESAAFDINKLIVVK